MITPPPSGSGAVRVEKKTCVRHLYWNKEDQGRGGLWFPWQRDDTMVTHTAERQSPLLMSLII